MVRSLQAMPSPRSRMQPSEVEPATDSPNVPEVAAAQREAERVVCIGASTGGPRALESIFKALPAAPATTYVVAQHMPARFTRAFAERLDRMSRLKILEAEDDVALLAGHAYVAPGGMHMVVQAGGDGVRLVRVHEAVEADRYIPSIDLLFRSVAESFGGASLAVVLTGMGSDGRAGVEAIRAAGGETVAESNETAIVFGMPKEAIETGCVDAVLPLPAIVDRLHVFARDVSLRAGA
jgi:two-component system chemotaxis response regulator CheB